MGYPIRKRFYAESVTEPPLNQKDFLGNIASGRSNFLSQAPWEDAGIS